MIRALTLTVALALPLPALAEIAPRMGQLFDLIGLKQTVEIMREEGLEYGADLQAELFPGQATELWTRDVDRIYAHEAMLDLVRQAMADALEGDDIEPIIRFFDSALGRQLVELEVSARRAIMDDDVEELAKTRFEDLAAELDPRVKLLEAFVEANDLVETNVTGALNANLAFYQALNEGGAFGEELPESELLADVWSQETEVRTDTASWVFSYLNMAYDPLEADELQAYIDFSNTDAGRDLNRALFVAFDRMFVEISAQLGTAAARYMSSNDI